MITLQTSIIRRYTEGNKLLNYVAWKAGYDNHYGSRILNHTSVQTSIIFVVMLTSSLITFADTFSPNYKLTIGVDFSLKTLEWKDAKINLQLWWETVYNVTIYVVYVHYSQTQGYAWVSL